MDKILEDFFPHKQMSEHANIRNTDNTKDLRENPEAEKITEERQLTISRTVVAECVVITSAQELLFFFPLLVGKEGIFISLVGDVGMRIS